MKSVSLKLKMSLAVSVLLVSVVTAIGVGIISFFEGRVKELISENQFTMLTALTNEIDDKIRLAQGELTAVTGMVPLGDLAGRREVERFLGGRTDTRLILTAASFCIPPPANSWARRERMIRGKESSPLPAHT